MYNDNGDNMTKEIKIEDIKDFQKEYITNKENIKIEKNIYENGLEKACFNKDFEKQQKYRFNIQIPQIKMYDQKNGYQCNIYAFLRMIKSIMKKDNSINTKRLDLSATYIDFYDKLEKVNTFYNELLKEENITPELINEKANRYIGVYGTFNFCKKIINKYGLVPSKYMNEVNEHYNANLMIELLRNKVKSDAVVLLNHDKKDNNSLKKELVKEAYIFLSKVLGNPPTNFEYKKELLTPLEFRNKYLKTSLNEYATLTTLDKNILYNCCSFIPSVYIKDDEQIITLKSDEIKQAVIKQLKDGIGVWFSSEESTTLNYDSNILDGNIYKYNTMLKIKDIPTNYSAKLDLINYDHAMCITGALVKNNKAKQFKVDNSFGYHGKYKGHLIMTSDFFDNYVLFLIVNKKYLTK